MQVNVRRLYLLLATALGISVLALGISVLVMPALAGPQSPETVQALAPYSWSPASTQVTAGGTVAFKNESGITHGIIWTGGTAGATPACTGIPIGTGNWSTSWSGSCTFAKAGTYTFECSYHMALMRGTITATTPGAPLVSTGSATPVGETEATLKGTVDPEGKATTYFFNYGTSASYGSRTGEEPAGEASVGKQVALPVGLLSPGTTYHFQLVAKNASGTTPGEDVTFRTLAPPSPPIPPPAPTPPTPPTSTPTTPVVAGSSQSSGDGASTSTIAPLATASGATEGTPSPSADGALPTLALAGSQHGGAVHGTIQIPLADAGARLEVELLAQSASPAKLKRAGGSRVGHLVEASTPGGRVSFTVALDAQAKRALRARHKLALEVRIVLTPKHGAPLTLARSVIVRA